MTPPVQEGHASLTTQEHSVDIAGTESWLPIPDWEGSYSISSLGRVRSEHRKVVRSDNVVIVIREKPRKVITWPNGRKTVRLRRDGQQFTVRIDRLVRELFGSRRTDLLDNVQEVTERPSGTSESAAS